MAEQRHGITVSFDVLSRILSVADKETKGKRQYLAERKDIETLHRQMREGGIKDLTPKCPICESDLMIRAGTYGDFLYCPKSSAVRDHGSFSASSRTGQPFGKGAIYDALFYQIKSAKKYRDAEHVVSLVRGYDLPTQIPPTEYPDDYFDGNVPDRETLESMSPLPW